MEYLDIKKYVDQELIKFLKTNPTNLLKDYQNIVENEETIIFNKAYKREMGYKIQKIINTYGAITILGREGKRVFITVDHVFSTFSVQDLFFDNLGYLNIWYNK